MFKLFYIGVAVLIPVQYSYCQIYILCTAQSLERGVT